MVQNIFLSPNNFKGITLSELKLTYKVEGKTLDDILDSLEYLADYEVFQATTIADISNQMRIYRNNGGKLTPQYYVTNSTYYVILH